MRRKVLFFIPLILAGCAQPDGPSTNQSPSNDFLYDERDAISSETSLPIPSIDQRSVVGTRRVLVSVIHWQDGDALNKNLIEKHTLSTDPDSLHSYVLAASYGKLSLTGRVIEYTSGPRPDICKGGTPLPMSLATAEGNKAALAHGLLPSSFSYLINIIDCGGSASAYVPGRIIGVYGQSASPQVYKHEFGHNLGYSHGQTYTNCPRDGETVEAPTGCTTIPYGDTGDSVSGGGTLYPASNRSYSGWLDKSQSAVIERSGLYRLGVLGQVGPQLYRINRTGLTPSQIALEYRKPTIYDDFPPTDNRVNGVWVRYTTIASSLVNTQLDGTPETASTTDPTLVKGKTLDDVTAGITVKMCTSDPSGATVSVAVNRETAPDCDQPMPQPVTQAPAPQAIVGTTPVFSGHGEPGAKISIRVFKNLTVLQFATIVDAQGAWSVPASAELSTGEHSFSTQQSINFRMSAWTVKRPFTVKR
ncbi:transposase [Pseudomonas sp. SDO5591_S426]